MLLPIATIGCDAIDLRQAAKTPTYKLDVRSEIKNGGIRRYAESIYTYSSLQSGTWRELWRLTRHDRYLRHWISPSGRLWVVTGGMPGPGGAASLWTRDPSGNGYGPWGFQNFLPPARRGGALYAQDGGAIDLDRVEARTLGRSGKSEQLRMPLKAGGESRVTLVARERAAPILLARSLEKGERDLVTEGLEASPYQDLGFTRPVERSPLALWQYREEKTGRTRRILQTLQQATFGDPIEGALVAVKREREVDLAPALAVRTPAARVLWFGLSRLGEPEAARLTVMRYDGTVLADVDLLKLGGYADLNELKARLRYHDVRTLRGGKWLPVEDDQELGTNSPETFEILDDRSRVLLTVEGDRAKVERFTGLAAKRPKEHAWPGIEYLSERTFASPNGKFTLRERRVRLNYPNTMYTVTLLGEGKEADGRTVPVELWSSVSSTPARQVRLTDSGRSFVFHIDPPYEKHPARPSLFVRDADGTQVAGIDLFQTPALYKTADEAEKGLRLDQMTLTEVGKVETKSVDGVPVRSAQSERYRLPLEPGRIWEFTIGPNPYNGGQPSLSWQTPAAGRP